MGSSIFHQKYGAGQKAELKVDAMAFTTAAGVPGCSATVVRRPLVPWCQLRAMWGQDSYRCED